MKNRALYLSPILAAALLAGCQPSNEKLAERYEGRSPVPCRDGHDAARRQQRRQREGHHGPAADPGHAAHSMTLAKAHSREVRGPDPPSGLCYAGRERRPDFPDEEEISA